MPLSVVAALMILTTVILSACVQEKGQSIVTIEDKGTLYYGRNPMMASTGATYQATSIDSILSTPIAAPAASAPTYQNTTPVLIKSHAPMQAASADGWSWPVQGRVTVPYGQRTAGIANEGITIEAPAGAAIKAAAGGEVAYVGTNMRDYGNMVIVRHPGGQLTSYAHARDILVSKGDAVIQGDVLGYVGQTGNAKTPQLHFAMREGSGAIDPMSKLPQQLASR